MSNKAIWARRSATDEKGSVVTGQPIDDKYHLHVVTDAQSLIAGVKFDDAQLVSQNVIQDHAEYYLRSELVATVEITYEDSSKSKVTRARRI